MVKNESTRQLKATIKKYNLKDENQQQDTLDYWKKQSIEHKLNVLETLRDDAIKMGLYPDFNEKKPRLQRVYKITSHS